MTHPCIKSLVKPHPALTRVCGLLAAASAHAQNPSHPLVLTAYANAGGGADLTSGKYAAALLQINRGMRAASDRGAAAHANLCVT